MTILGSEFIIDVRSNAKTRAHGIALLASPAAMESDFSCYLLATLYDKGHHITKSYKEAIYCYKKATDGSCGVKHIKLVVLSKATD